MRGVLAEAVSGGKRGQHVHRCDEPVGGNARREDGRLRVLGQLQAILGPLEAERGQGFTQRGIGLRKGVLADCGVIRQCPAHPDLLRALTGEDESDHVSLEELRGRTRSAGGDAARE
jgi:hypothetical protein